MSRWLRTGPAGERRGFTADALLGDRRRGDLMAVAAAVSLTSEARGLGTDETFRGGGGTFGGGGASARSRECRPPVAAARGGS